MQMNNLEQQQAIAKELEIDLDAKDLLILEILQNFYTTFDHMPNRRAFTNFAKPILAQNSLDASVISSINLTLKFGESPVKTMAKICGLPEPENCL